MTGCFTLRQSRAGRSGQTYRQASTLRQIEAYHASMKQEIAVTRRATYKAEEAIQQLEKDKGHQDTLIDKLQETLKGLHQQAALLTAQVAAFIYRVHDGVHHIVTDSWCCAGGCPEG